MAKVINEGEVCSFDCHVEDTCAFCGLVFRVGQMKIGEQEPIGSVMHATPECAVFRRLDCVEFLREHRLKKYGEATA